MFGKDIFKSGEYVQYFYPDDKRNPFFKIYALKKQDTINIINKTNSNKTILDIGGGMGRLSLLLAQSKQNKVVLTDISMSMLKLAFKLFNGCDNITLVNSDAHHLPFLDNTFDHVVGLDLLCHLEMPESALREFYRVLSDKGTLILDSTNSKPYWTFFFPRYLGKNPITWLKIFKYRGIYPGWEKIVKHYRKEEFLSFLHQAGFKVIQNINYGPRVCYKWHLIVAKKSLNLN